jgi:hypothetical protein
MKNDARVLTLFQRLRAANYLSYAKLVATTCCRCGGIDERIRHHVAAAHSLEI